MAKTTKRTKIPASDGRWYHLPGYATLIMVIALVAAYLMASRALFTGSLQQWFMAIVLLGLSFNRLAHLIKLGFRKVHTS